MSTVTPLVVRMRTLTVRAALSTIFAALAAGRDPRRLVCSPDPVCEGRRRLVSQRRSRIRPRHE